MTQAVISGLGLLNMSILKIDYPFVLIAVDPGGTTGIAVYNVTEESASPIKFEQWGDPDNVWRELQKLADEYENSGSEVIIVIEQWDKRPGIASPDFTPMFIIKDIKRNLDYNIIWQTVSQAKNLVKPATNGAPDGLKRFGWYQPGMRHANDASRHAILFLTETIKHMPTILRGWPKRG